MQVLVRGLMSFISSRHLPISIFALGDQIILGASGVGKIQLQLLVNNEHISVTLCDVLYLNEATGNLLSLSKTIQARKKATFHNNNCEILTLSSKLLGRAIREGNVYKLLTSRHFAKLLVHRQPQPMELWHNRLRHVSSNTLNLLQQGAGEGVKFKEGYMPMCEACTKGEKHQLPFPNFSSTSTLHSH